VAAGVQSLARGVAQNFGGRQVRQTLIEMDSAFLFVTAAGEGSCLAVLASTDADAGLIAYEMAVLVRRVGEHLAVNSRPANPASEARQQRCSHPIRETRSTQGRGQARRPGMAGRPAIPGCLMTRTSMPGPSCDLTR